MKRALLALAFVSVLLPLAILVFGGDRAVAGAIAAGSFTIPATFLFGVPMFLECRRRGWLKWKHAVAGGIVTGAACSLPFWFGGWFSGAVFMLTFAAYGVILATIFWGLAIWRNTSLTSASSRPAIKPAGGLS